MLTLTFEGNFPTMWALTLQLHNLSNLDFSCENKMAPGVSECILRAEHESALKNYP